MYSLCIHVEREKEREREKNTYKTESVRMHTYMEYMVCICTKVYLYVYIYTWRNMRMCIYAGCLFDSSCRTFMYLFVCMIRVAMVTKSANSKSCG